VSKRGESSQGRRGQHRQPSPSILLYPRPSRAQLLLDRRIVDIRPRIAEAAELVLVVVFRLIVMVGLVVAVGFAGVAVYLAAAGLLRRRTS